MSGLMGLDAEWGYTGEITVDGEKVPVTNGQTNYQGKTYYVSKDGSIVIDQQKQIVGSIKGKTFVPVNQKQLEQLHKRGVTGQQGRKQG